MRLDWYPIFKWYENLLADVLSSYNGVHICGANNLHGHLQYLS